MAKAKFDIKTEATKGLHAGIGVADLAYEAVLSVVTEAQKRFDGYSKDAQKAFASAQKSVKDFEFQPKALRSQATTVVTARVDELSKDAKARRTAIEKRVAELQTEAVGTYAGLAKRGETVLVKGLGNGKPEAKKTTATKAPATKKSTAKKAPAKKTTAKKAPAKKA
jgi:heparin binding hemagglutinin HbhA